MIKNEWIELVFRVFRVYRFWEDRIIIEDFLLLEKYFFKGEYSVLELFEENIYFKKNIEKWYKWGKVLNYLFYEYELYYNFEMILNFDGSIESIEYILL